MSSGVFRWRLNGFGEQAGKFYLSRWRHGHAAAGEPATVTRIEWFSTEQQRAASLDALIESTSKEN